MDDEVEDIVGKVEYKDSQKSVATTNIYSLDFTDSSSDRNNSSGKDTYVIEYDSDDSELEICEKQSAFNVEEIPVAAGDKDAIGNYEPYSSQRCSFESGVREKCNLEHGQYDSTPVRGSSTSTQRCLYEYVAQETFTQTSRTVFELAQLDSFNQRIDHKAIETQTSFVSIIKNGTCDYTIQVDENIYFTENTLCSEDAIENFSSLKDDTLRRNISEIDRFQVFSTNKNNNKPSIGSYKTNTDSLEIIDEYVKDSEDKDLFENTSDYENTSKCDSDFEIDSLHDGDDNEDEVGHQDRRSESSFPLSVDCDVEELYSNLKKSLDLRNLEKPTDANKTRVISLSPLSEESTVVKKNRSSDITSNSNIDTQPDNLPNLNVIFMNKFGEPEIEVSEHEKKSFKLPPIHNQSCPSNPHLNSLFGSAANKLGKRNTSPSLLDRDAVDRRAVETQDLAAGESTRIREKHPDQESKGRHRLPSIYIEGHVNYGDSVDSSRKAKSIVSSGSPRPRETISIQEKIKDLKMNNDRKYRMPQYRSPSPGSRSVSPGSAAPDDAPEERSCDMLCQAVIKRLQSHSWLEVIEVLEDMENVFKNVWYFISEQRVADLIRQISYIRTLGGRDTSTKVSRIMKFCLTDEIAENYNFYGKRSHKKPFCQLRLRDCYQAVLSLLTCIKTQNDQIIRLFKHRGTGTSKRSLKPELKFPIQNADELNTIESSLGKKENHDNLVSVHVESPRTQLVRAACGALAAVLRNTNYTKKPDFFEAVTCLLTKTGSYSKPVRHAANTALDGVVSGAGPGHAVAALCAHGVSHKSGLVRCAAARLLAVSAALAGGGRGLLRARPPPAARARRLALRALADLLDDKNKDTRKYAERLYSMLRPHPNFEAYYLTDVDFDKASKQMKKYDPILFAQSLDEER